MPSQSTPSRKIASKPNYWYGLNLNPQPLPRDAEVPRLLCYMAGVQTTKSKGNAPFLAGDLIKKRVVATKKEAKQDNQESRKNKEKQNQKQTVYVQKNGWRVFQGMWGNREHLDGLGRRRRIVVSRKGSEENKVQASANGEATEDVADVAEEGREFAAARDEAGEADGQEGDDNNSGGQGDGNGDAAAKHKGTS